MSKSMTILGGLIISVVFLFGNVGAVSAQTMTVDPSVLSSMSGFLSPSLTGLPDLTGLPNLTALSNCREQWLKSSLYGRQALAEQIGEGGAKRFAECRGWKSILQGPDKWLRQGFDQVYTYGEKVIVVEAKGGTSTLNDAYGYRQGSSEWAVEAAKRTLRSHGASDVERSAAKRVLLAAKQGHLQVATLRTSHILGTPTSTVLISFVGTSEQAKFLSLETTYNAFVETTESMGCVKSVIPSMAKAERVAVKSTVVGKSAVKGTVRTGSKVLKGTGVIGAGVDLGMRGYESYQTEQAYRNGEITNAERTKAHVQNGAGLAGGWGGAVFGAKGGSLVGAAIGSVFPGPGTAIGGTVGGLVGGVGGYLGGESLATKGVDSVMTP